MLPAVIIVCALCGLSLAAFIRMKKKLAKPLICPIGHSCDPVVHSDYSRFLHIPVEIFGILYYATIAIAYTATFAIPSLRSDLLTIFLLSLSTIALCFSLYLTAVQAFVLREWCTWCLLSAFLCAFILFFSLLSADVTIGTLASFFISNLSQLK